MAAVLIFGGMLTGVPTEASAGEIVMIANTSVPAENLDHDAIKNIFLGKTVQWKNNEMITIVVSEKSDIHENFLEKFVKRTKNQFNTAWRQNLFTGTGKQPEKVDSIDELVKLVSKTPGAVGYASSDTPLPGDVKIIAR